MKYILMRTILFPALLLSSLLCENVNAALYWGIPDTRLPYIAMVRRNPNETTIVIYNPDTCKEIGAACGFFIEHAGAHPHRNHILLPPEAYPLTLEDEADCWAAKNGRPHEVYAAVRLFLDENRNPNLNITGDSVQRAKKVRACAEEAGNWIENQ
ncbi:MAG: hypothetical protein ACE1ZG_06780 [Gammaproteobacteria bacterium]